MTWTSPEPAPVDGPLVGDDRPMLEGYLDWQRSTLLNICAGLTAEQLASRPIPSTNLSLLGLVRHMAKVERIWFRERAIGQDFGGPMYDAGLGKDADFEDIQAEDAPAAVERLRAESRLAKQAAADLPWDSLVPSRDGDLSLRFVHVHMIGEYARHNGHADLCRQAIDGVTAR